MIITLLTLPSESCNFICLKFVFGKILGVKKCIFILIDLLKLIPLVIQGLENFSEERVQLTTRVIRVL